MARRLRRLLAELGLWAVAALHVYPVVLVLLSALKEKADLATNPFGLPRGVTLEHFRVAWQVMRYFRSLFNSALVTAASVLALVVAASAAAYAIIRRGTRPYGALYLYFLAGMFVPFQMCMIPLYKLMLTLRLINTYPGLVLVYVALETPLAMFLFSGFIRSVPVELEEAAVIDGCGLYSVFIRIALPLLRPAIATISVLVSFVIWNDFLQPLLFLTSRDRKTLVVQLFAFVGQYFNDWSPIFAAIFLIVYPILVLYLVAQKSIIRGITAGALKG